jgi:redox-sensitive bicupin YhaK (pirin superfamily)
MITKYDADRRGRTRLAWLDGRHTFSFGEFQDPERMGFRTLRVLNDDRVLPGRGFGMHPHENMEIVTWILSGALEHKDSMGNGSVIRPGDVQRMTAGTGVLHREWNPSGSDIVHLLQIWILPEEQGLEPGYEETRFEDLGAYLRLVASPDGRGGSVTIHQDAEIRVARLPEGGETTYQPAVDRHVFVQAALGEIDVNGVLLEEGAGAALSGETEIRIEAETDSEVLLFDVA